MTPACRCKKRARRQAMQRVKSSPPPSRCSLQHRSYLRDKDRDRDLNPFLRPGLILPFLLLSLPYLPQTSAIRTGDSVDWSPKRYSLLRGAAGSEASWQGDRFLDQSYDRSSTSQELGGSGDEQGDISRCQNTKQGRVLVSDDRGYTCKRWELNFKTGCCNPKEHNVTVHRRASSKSLLVYPRTAASIPGQYSCATCDVSKGCCSTYEYCVSCCLDPERTPAKAALAVKRAQQASAEAFSSVFEFCATQCRHNSKSVVHENAYISELHHCYALPSAAHSPTSTPAKLGNDVTVLVSNQGMSCNDACAKANMQCEGNYLPLLNNCTVMRQHLACHAGCFVSAGPDQPAEVMSSAPMRQQPGACVVNGNPALFSCSGFHENTRRLCPCKVGLSVQ